MYIIGYTLNVKQAIVLKLVTKVKLTIHKNVTNITYIIWNTYKFKI